MIELLVVVAIIALLISILTPALQRVRAQARLTQCVANLRSQGTAILHYAHDHQDRLPPRQVFWIRTDGTVNTWLINAFLAYTEGRPFTRDEGDLGWATPEEIWRCVEIPVGDDVDYVSHWGIIHAAPNQWLFNGLSMNDTTGEATWYGEVLQGWEPRNDAMGWRRTSALDRPGELMMLMENVNYYFEAHGHREAREYYGRACEIMNPGDPSCGDNVGPHAVLGKRAAVFLDGHASEMPISRAFWQDVAGTYRGPGREAPPYVLFAREVKHLMWFVQGDDAVPP